MGSPVKNFRYALELLLACGIPNLELENLLLQFDEQGSELDANSHFMICHKLIIGQPVQQTWFSNGGIPDDNQFK